MTGPLLAVPDPDQPAVVDEALRLAEALERQGETDARPPVQAVCFADYVDVDDVAECQPDELVSLYRETGTFERGAAGLAARVAALADHVAAAPPGAILFASTPDGDDLAARLAGRLGEGCVTDCLLRVREGALVAGRPVYDDRAFGTVTFERSTPVVSLAAEGCGRPRSRPDTTDGREVTVDGDSDGDDRIREVARLDIPERDLSRARAIVAGGRGLGDPDGFDVVEDLADALAASVGASRPPADDGWVPYDRQIGVTGAEIDPELYVPCAISGDPYHMRAVDAAHVIAINDDPDAPIFETADLGVVGDVFEYGPAIAAAVRARRDQATAPPDSEVDDD
jgi:electron transfer flavoprotein alpha subunit